MSGPRQVGDWIGDRFEVFEVHLGGMGLVYVVHDHFGDHGPPLVALKTLRDEFLGDDHRRARFDAECRLWARLGHHPNIVHALGVEAIDGKPHVLMELVRGGDLRRWIGTPRLDLPRALAFGVQFCLGLEHAVERGLRCHRDVKPGNLLIAADGTLKLTDFGLASVRDEILAEEIDDPDAPIPLDADEPEPPPPPEPADPEISFSEAPVGGSTIEARPAAVAPPPEPGSTVIDVPGEPASPFQTTLPHDPGPLGPPGDSMRLTRTGLMIGTLPYMAPEQFVDSKAADVRADIYGFGVVLHEMIVGELPFRGRTLAMLRRQHTRYEAPSVRPAIPRKFAKAAGEVEELVARCLRKEPDDRFPTVLALRKALIKALRRTGPSSNRK